MRSTDNEFTAMAKIATFIGVLTAISSISACKLMPAQVTGISGQPNTNSGSTSNTVPTPPPVYGKLEFKMGDNGPTTMKFNGVELLDLTQGAQSYLYSAFDPSHAWLDTTLISKTFSNNTITWNYNWGTVALNAVAVGSDIKLTTSVTMAKNTAANLASIAVMFGTLKLPQYTTPYNWGQEKPEWAEIRQLGFGSGQLVTSGLTTYVTAVSPGTNPFYFVQGGPPDPTMGGPLLNLTAGKTFTKSSLFRFATNDIPLKTLASDAYAEFRNEHPYSVNWPDRRPMGVLTSGTSWTLNAKNPNGWFNGATDVDVTTQAGRDAFATRMLQSIDTTIANAQAMNAQGMIFWDIEGERFWQPVTYIGDPRVIDDPRFAPEMSTLVNYNGQQMKLIDAIFRKWRDAGLKVGLTIRPQQITFNGKNGTDPVAGDIPDQVDVAAGQNQIAQVAQLLIDKITYAKNRWGATIFYIDSTDQAQIGKELEIVHAAHPDVLLCPENKGGLSYAFGAPFNYVKFHGWLSDEITNIYPQAFQIMTAGSMNLNDQVVHDQLVKAIKNGTIVLFESWWANPDNPRLKAIYQEATAK